MGKPFLPFCFIELLIMETLLSSLYFLLEVTRNVVALQIAGILIVLIPIFILSVYYVAFHTPYKVGAWLKTMTSLSVTERDSWFVVNTPKFIWVPAVFTNNFCHCVWTVAFWFAVLHCLDYFCFIPLVGLFS